jgi:hypothetical protein
MDASKAARFSRWKRSTSVGPRLYAWTSAAFDRLSSPALARSPLDESREAPRREDEQRGDDQRNQRQLPLQVKDRGGEEGESEDVRDEVGHA